MPSPRPRPTGEVYFCDPVPTKSEINDAASAQNFTRDEPTQYTGIREETAQVQKAVEQELYVQGKAKEILEAGSRSYPDLDPWPDYEWDPWLGCKPVSRGCLNCYAARRVYEADPNHPAVKLVANRATFTGVTYCNPDMIRMPLLLEGRKVIFLGAHSDIFQPVIVNKPVRLHQVHEIIARVPHLINILTKYPENALAFYEERGRISDNIRLGISAETQKTLDERWAILREIPAVWKILSLQPLLEHINLPKNLEGTQTWVVAMREVGHGVATTKPEWIESLRLQCDALRIPFFWETTDQDDGPLVQLRIHPPAGRKYRAQPRSTSRFLVK